jgi:hypothetical protein
VSVCESARMLSDGAEMFTREPNPLEKFAKPVQRVSGHVS